MNPASGPASASRCAQPAGQSDHLSQALLQAVRSQGFEHTQDRWQGGAPVGVFPSIDLAVVRFAAGAEPEAANVLFSREHPAGLTAEFSGSLGSINNIRFDCDQQDARGDSVAWLPGADWQQLRWQTLHGAGPQRMVVPYPASLLKLMVAVGLGLAVDAGRCGWPAELEPMLTVSSNEATDACVALLHRVGHIDTLNHTLRGWGLHTLQLNNTTAEGGWRNADGAGVGHIHMTAWDTVRLLWLLDADAPNPPWLAPGVATLQPATRVHLRAALARQALDEILSSGSLRGVTGWVQGLPDAPAFAHKTGTTDNYASDAGIVKTDRAHYLVAVLTTLGRRFAAPDPERPDHASRCATTWRLPALGAALHHIMESER
jgi:hypothetical protein